MAGCAGGGREVGFVRADALTPTLSTGEGENTKNGNLGCRFAVYQAFAFSQFNTTSW